MEKRCNSWTTEKERGAAMPILLELFLTFAKIGLFTFGGGYAMIALIEDACVDRKKWITQEEMMDITIIAESTPGPIAINCATFTGYKTGGFWGAVAATVGVTLPSLVIIFLISMFLDNFLELTVIANAFKGIKIAVGILIVSTGVNMLRKMQKKWLPRVIMACSCGIMLCINLFSWSFSSISLMLIAAAVSLVIFLIRGAPEQKGGGKQ
jgi:chromate transporter